jgi:hypothetical protein
MIGDEGGGTSFVVFNGDVVTLFHSGYCVGAPPANYRWSLTEGVLHFTSLDDDPCPRKGLLAHDYIPSDQ